eukprot:GHVU01119586.1.p1 GENE.GHVU01119586.1~~GHVU01119586.1.p1  ORF type:complete len:291 (+),score=35.63 GHVU01119586.1:654-1526(+)
MGGVCNPYKAGVGIGLAKLAGICTAILLVDRTGRRRLLMAGSIGTCVCNFLFAATFAALTPRLRAAEIHELTRDLLQEASRHAASSVECSASRGGTVVVAVMLLYMFCWNISWAGLMFVVASEVLPSVVRAAGMAMTIFAFWSISFLVQSSLETFFAVLGKSGTFAIYGLTNLPVILFVHLYVPETMGASLEAISRSMNGGGRQQKESMHPSMFDSRGNGRQAGNASSVGLHPRLQQHKHNKDGSSQEFVIVGESPVCVMRVVNPLSPSSSGSPVDRASPSEEQAGSTLG